ncbi:TPA: FecCD family ABC transporter permease [Pseudomonas aeruginosa]
MSLRLSPLPTMAAALALLLVVGSLTGSVGLSPALFGGSLPTALEWQVWTQVRLPRLLLAVLVGATLAAGGTTMQGLFRNPLADPTLLGQASGAGLAVSVWIVLFNGRLGGLELYGQFFAGFLGALLVTLLVFRLGHARRGGESTLTLLLAGLVINTLAGALGGILTYLASEDQLRQLSLWGMGSLSSAEWSTLGVALLVLPLALVVLTRCAAGLDLFQLGELSAHAAGLDCGRLKNRVVLASSLGVGLCVALTGIIGFIGLLVPHCLRLYFGPGHRLLIPASMICGAALLLLADTLARTLASPAEIPVGLVTSVIGGPYFLWLLLGRRIREF